MFQKLLKIKYPLLIKRDNSPKNKATQICWAGHDHWTHWRHTRLGLFPHGLALITHFLSALIGGRWNLGQTSYPGFCSQKIPGLEHTSLFFLPVVTVLKLWYRPGFYLNTFSLMPDPWILTLPSLDSNLVFFSVLMGWLAEQGLETRLILFEDF